MDPASAPNHLGSLLRRQGLDLHTRSASETAREYRHSTSAYGQVKYSKSNLRTKQTALSDSASSVGNVPSAFSTTGYPVLDVLRELKHLRILSSTNADVGR